MERNGMEWYDIELKGMVWDDVVWDGVVWEGMGWLGDGMGVIR